MEDKHGTGTDSSDSDNSINANVCEVLTNKYKQDTGCADA